MVLNFYMGRYELIKFVQIFVCLHLRYMDLLQYMSRYSADVVGNR